MQYTEREAAVKEAVKKVNSIGTLAEEISLRAIGDRCLVAIVGAPGSGKSTTSAILQTELETQHNLTTQIVPMDGFHFDNAILQQRDLVLRKGSPQTFDVDALESILVRLTSAPVVDVVVPVFDRENDLSRASARDIYSCTRVVLVEGNYLLLDAAPWNKLKQYFNYSVMIHCEESVLRQRLMDRWLDLDFAAEDAQLKVEANDLPNAVTVISQSLKSDITLVGESRDSSVS